ncbi:olfactory receptor 2F1-like [Nelusetta ayraudi]|uniref:olfactory receptor 2F1-like n=1 Tax=Nelusetta ayraudi TaxID=303726 RepID=UPI003F71CD3B
MNNLTQVSSFTLAGYLDVGPLRYLYFLLVLTFYSCVLAANLLLLLLICCHRSLHQPMYIFLCSLCVNEVYGSSSIFPLLLQQLLSELHTVPAPLCFLQIFCLYSYGGVEFCTLTAMSYDRYLAICCPLQYRSRMTGRRMAALTAAAWLYPFAINIFIVCGLTMTLPLCGSVIDKVYCDNFYVVKLACGDTSLNNIFGLTHMFVVIFGLILLILYTYVRILRVCVGGSAQTRQKALSTCTPHLASLANFSFGCFFEIVQSRFNLQHLPNLLRVLLSLYWLTMQPLVNPLLYGLKMTKIRSVYGALLTGRKP